MSDPDVRWPRISIVTPSFNQATYLERTIHSVLDQVYPNLEYLIIDGGSTDGSVEIIRRYARDLAYWVSEPDEGQFDAINKGSFRSTGAILGSLNSDDTYLPGTLKMVARYFVEHPDVEVVYGNANMIDERDAVIRQLRDTGFNRRALLYGAFNMPPQCTFYRRDIFEAVGGFRKEFYNASDYDLVLRFSAHGARFAHLPQVLGNFRAYPEAKTSKYWANARKETTRARQDIFGVRDTSRAFRVWQAVYFARRLALFVSKGEMGYVLESLAHRLRPSGNG